MEAPVRKVASGIIAAPAEFRGTSPPRPLDLLEETEPNPEETGARNLAPRGFPDVMLGSAHARKDSPIWLRTSFLKGPLESG
jgi:hypothetical protein